MNVKKNLASLKASHKENFKIFKFIIESFGMTPVSWNDWRNKLGDSFSIYDDGDKLNYKFSYDSTNDLLQYSRIKDVLKYSSILIGINKKNTIKIWMLGKDGIIRSFEFDQKWSNKHLFDSSPSLIIQIIGMFLNVKDDISKKFKINDYIIFTEPFDDLSNDNKNFQPLWEELGV